MSVSVRPSVQRCLALALGACLLAVACTKAPQEAPPPPIPVTVFAVGGTGDADGERYSASVTPYQLVRVASQVSGTVLELATRKGADGAVRPLQGGDEVVQGDFLARIDDATYREQVSKAEAALEGDRARYQDAKVEYERAKELFEQQVVSASEYDRKTARYESSRSAVAKAEHAVEEARIDLGHCRIVATSDGVVLQRDVEIGDLVSPGTEVFQVADLSRVKVVFGVSGQVAQSLELGSVVTMVVEALGSREFAGRITRISPAADATSRLFDIEVTVANGDEALKVGMIAALRLPSADDDATPNAGWLLPLDAVVRPQGQADGYAVFVVDGSGENATARQQVVETGAVFGNDVVVAQGLSADDRVVIRGATLLHDGAAVRVMP